jgi:hypothetical protein
MENQIPPAPLAESYQTLYTNSAICLVTNMAANPVRGVLVEELANSVRLLKRYRQALAALPKGSLVAKKIKGGIYYYAAYRAGGKVRFEYKGKLSGDQVERLEKAASQKARYRRLIADLKEQLVFIRRALHERKRRAH